MYQIDIKDRQTTTKYIKEREMKEKRQTEIDRQTDRDRETDRQRKQIDRHRDIHIDTETYRQIDRE